MDHTSTAQINNNKLIEIDELKQEVDRRHNHERQCRLKIETLANIVSFIPNLVRVQQ